MARPSRFSLVKNDIVSVFPQTSGQVFSEAQLFAIFHRNRLSWQLPEYIRPSDFISFLIKNNLLRVHKFRCELYSRTIVRYAWGNVSSLELALSMKSRAYFSHGTAATLHRLTQPNARKIYLNAEQSKKPQNEGSLNQEGIDRAFAGRQRQSKLIYKKGNVSVVMIAGKNTDRLGVEEIAGPELETLQTTNLERTLIDIVVRPAYSGGISEVLKAFREAKDRTSIELLMHILNQISHAYPYHQAIGFLMQTAGYVERDYNKLKALGLKYDFHLTHGISTPEYSKDWRLFFPKGFK